jgi:hypothetical protein
MGGVGSAKNAVAYTTITSEADAELARVREAAVRQRIAEDVAAVVARMEDAESEALAVWVAMDDTEDDESIHALGSLMRLTHLRGKWMGALFDWRAASYRGEVSGPEPRRPEVFTIVDDLEVRRRTMPMFA